MGRYGAAAGRGSARFGILAAAFQSSALIDAMIDVVLQPAPSIMGRALILLSLAVVSKYRATHAVPHVVETVGVSVPAPEPSYHATPVRRSIQHRSLHPLQPRLRRVLRVRRRFFCDGPGARGTTPRLPSRLSPSQSPTRSSKNTKQHFSPPSLHTLGRH